MNPPTPTGARVREHRVEPVAQSVAEEVAVGVDHGRRSGVGGVEPQQRVHQVVCGRTQPTARESARGALAIRASRPSTPHVVVRIDRSLQIDQ
jgi:hypothetical protein